MKPALLIALVLAASPALDSARAGYGSAKDALAAAHAQVAAQQHALDALSAQIAADKARQPGQPLFVPGALEHELAQSQALSDALAKSRAAESVRAAQLESARGALYQALSSEISAREAQGAHDAAALDVLAKLQAERAQVEPSSQGAVAAPQFSKPTDDPTLLRERADALRDQADKIGKQQVALAARIQSARDQAELESQLRQLNGDESLFDESDRRVRVSRQSGVAADTQSTTGTPALGTTGGTGAAGATGGGGGERNTATEAYGGYGSADLGGTPDQNGPGAFSSAPPPSPAQPQAQPDAVPVPNAPSVQSGELVRPDQLSRTSAATLDDDASLGELLRAQKQLEAQREALEAQARALDAKAAGK